jgi:peptidoglycan/LPS O-acetylase OafA/YrhL
MRLVFVQGLRVLLICLVVAHHAGQPYGPTGGEWPIDDPANTEWLGPFFGVNAGFFMGFFFLLAGYFTGSSYDRKGAAAFARDRLIRLGIPLAVFTFVVFPVTIYFWAQPPGGFLGYYLGDYIGGWNIEEGHLWFVAQLLLYSLLYAMWRLFSASRPPAPRAVPGDAALATYLVSLAIAGTLVRSVSPQDAWVHLFWLVSAEPAHLPQYVSLFLIGIAAGYGNWLTTLPTTVGVRWFAVGVAAFAVAGVLRGMGDLPFEFGIVWGFLEAFICVGMILGLSVLFRRFCTRPNHALDFLDANVYGAYLVHWLLVVAIQAAIIDFAWSANTKFAFVTVLGIALSFAISAALRAIPAVRRVV